MSDNDARNGGGHADDPFAPGEVEESIVWSLRTDMPETPATALVRSLADAYAPTPATEAALTRSRATLARRAAALGAGDRYMNTFDFPSTVTAPMSTPPQPPRRRRSHVGLMWRTAAAVLIVALLSAGFYSLFRVAPRLGGHATPTPAVTRTPVIPTVTPSPTAKPATATPVPLQPPAPFGVYITTPSTLLLLNPSTGVVQQRYPFTSSSQSYVGAPVVANGVVYFTYQSTISPWDSAVVALSATSGAQLWRTKTAALLTQLSLAKGILYGGTESAGGGGDTFYALRARDGAVLWTFPTSTGRALAVVAGGLVYVTNQPEGTSAQYIHALRASDGARLWDTQLPQACGIGLFEAVDQGTVVVACGAPFNTGQGGDGVVYGLRASDGNVLWRHATNGQPYVVAAGAGLVYVSLGGKNAAGANVTGLDALDETSGAVVWQAPDGGGWPVFDGGVVYASVGSSLAAFSASRGVLLWTYAMANQRIESGYPTIAGAVVYEVLNERVVAISTSNGALLWRSPTVASVQQGVGGLTVVSGG